VALCSSLINVVPSLQMDSNDLILGLEKATWPGRCQTLPPSAHIKPPCGSILLKRNVRYHLDCAHTPLSIEAAVDWFERATGAGTNAIRVLIFNCSHEKVFLCFFQLAS
jgi:folylpolyglutamate synthase/dihydropteroate synthase